jgi:hypothetical protein
MYITHRTASPSATVSACSPPPPLGAAVAPRVVRARTPPRRARVPEDDRDQVRLIDEGVPVPLLRAHRVVSRHLPRLHRVLRVPLEEVRQGAEHVRPGASRVAIERVQLAEAEVARKRLIRVAVVSNRHVEHRARDEPAAVRGGLPHPARVRVRGGVRLRARRRRARGGLAPGELGKARVGAGAGVDGDLRERRRAPRGVEGGAARDQGVHVRARGRVGGEPGALADAVGLRPEVLAVPRAREAVVRSRATLGLDAAVDDVHVRGVVLVDGLEIRPRLGVRPRGVESAGALVEPRAHVRRPATGRGGGVRRVVQRRGVARRARVEGEEEEKEARDRERGGRRRRPRAPRARHRGGEARGVELRERGSVRKREVRGARAARRRSRAAERCYSGAARRGGPFRPARGAARRVPTLLGFWNV